MLLLKQRARERMPLHRPLKIKPLPSRLLKMLRRSRMLQQANRTPPTLSRLRARVKARERTLMLKTLLLIRLLKTLQVSIPDA
jgi:hypothetical protein